MQTCSPTSCRAASPCSGLLSSCHGRNSLHKPCMTVQAHAQGRYPFATPSDQLKQPSCRGCGKHGVAVQTENRRVQWQQPHARSRRQCSRTPASASTQSTGVSVFPAGQSQAKVRLPAVWLSLTASEALDEASTNDAVSSALAGGTTGVVLSEDDSGGSVLYDAACHLRELLRGRAALLIVDRTDIVDAAEADGVLLSPRGLPTGVARRMMSGGASLVGRMVSTADESATAAKDGANFVVLQPGSDDMAGRQEYTAAKQQQRGAGIPVIAGVPAGSGGEGMAALLSGGIDGVSVPLASLPQLASAAGGSSDNQEAGVQSILGAIEQGRERALKAPADAPGTQEDASALSALGQMQLVDDSKAALVERERALLTDALALLDEVCPEMDERGLLVDAIKQLDELFLLVVVGEFNSGKSSVINALLGGRFLEEGILPTTNEINVLKFAEHESDAGTVQNADGFSVRRVGATLLRNVNVVDTPGTNVILERQQRLTEEYVPRADLVLFVVSADRPFTESEVEFLQYIRKWGKKVVFLLNKVDILSSDEEVQEVVDFVAQNAKRLLGVEIAQVLPVAARKALAAKIAIGGTLPGGQLSSDEVQRLSEDAQWRASRFGKLEDFIFDFLVGGGRTAAEAVRLKLQTPLFVADALLAAAGQQLAAELATAQEELRAVSLVGGQLSGFAADMERDSKAQRLELAAAVDAVARRGGAFIDDTLQLGNTQALSTYIFGSRRSQRSLPAAQDFEAAVVEDMAGQLRRQVEEHADWLKANCERQVANYRSFAEQRAQQLGRTFDSLFDDVPAEEAAEQRRKWREQRAAAAAASESNGSGNGAVSDTSDGEETGLVPSASAKLAVANFDAQGLAGTLEDVVRQAALSSAGNAVGALGAGWLSTWFLAGTLEDLLALGLAAAVAYVSVVNLPLKRREAKDQLRELCTEFVKEVQDKLAGELRAGVTACNEEITAFIKPLEAATAAEVARVEKAEADRSALLERLGDLKMQAANVE